ncbi:MAG: hypothetical protein A3E87_11040 [Gammaproteobacteria bacterium RIFCSPHIGHO2_12_FULL_35_23]|nr:MAG: hypothetical protein A3E87_11040 [Gammaproteobacteria bacterium RIFCSPHIGHO2_12_FULL_35_23]
MKITDCSTVLIQLLNIYKARHADLCVTAELSFFIASLEKFCELSDTLKTKEEELTAAKRTLTVFEAALLLPTASQVLTLWQEVNDKVTQYDSQPSTVQHVLRKVILPFLSLHFDETSQIQQSAVRQVAAVLSQMKVGRALLIAKTESTLTLGEKSRFWQPASPAGSPGAGDEPAPDEARDRSPRKPHS